MSTATPPDSNVLTGASLSHIMVASLPIEAPSIKHSYEAIALGAHAAMLAVGFRLVGLGEDHKIEAQSDSDRPAPLPTAWNAHSGSYSFRYKHNQSSMEYLLRCSRMGNKVVIMGMGMGDDRTAQCEVTTADYVSDGNLPVNVDSLSEEESRKKFQDAFISAGRLSDLGNLMRVKIIQRLIPSLQKEGYEETQDGPSSRQPAPGREDNRPRYDPLREPRDPPAQPHPLHDPLVHPRGPRRPMPEPIPGFDDEHEIMRPGRGMPQGGFPRYGDQDLYPQGLGPHDPIRGGIGPGFGGPRGGGGMHPNFDDPLFAGQGRQGGGFDPQAPPGARFDPPFGPGQGGHPRGAGMGGRPPNPFGGFGDGDFI